MEPKAPASFGLPLLKGDGRGIKRGTEGGSKGGREGDLKGDFELLYFITQKALYSQTKSTTVSLISPSPHLPNTYSASPK